MNPKIWGPHGWIFLHSIAYGYPNDPTPDEKKAAINFFNSLGHMLPCKTCSELYKKDLVLFKKTNELKKAVENKTNLIKFINLIHNNVNKSLNKKQYSDIEYDNYYKNMYENKTTNFNYILLLLIIFILTISYLILS
tara:strand:+ start:925 stop:1335 length:411 start_codon:yes stop_codon:yes gene_type:complete